MKPVAIYARVSTTKDEQEKSLDAQVESLKKYCEFRQWEYQVFTEQQSGMKDESKRPELAKLMALVRRGKFSGIVVTTITRLGRHPLHNIKLWYELAGLRVNFTAAEDGIDTSSPFGESLFVFMTQLGKMQRDMISKSVRRGLDYAKSKGKILGRPRRAVDLKAVLAFKGSLRQAQTLFGVSKDTIANMRKNATNGGLTTSKTP